jgi:hypothetical protein
MTLTFSRRLLLVPACGATAILLLVGHTATAQSATGTITGRVLWSNCIRAIPLPAAPDAANGAAPDTQAQGQPQIPSSASGLPAGAVLVAVQSTPISARTDEAGRFSLSGVPAGQYLTVAAGPVANATAAVAERPNVMVNGGQTVDLGTLNLGGTPAPISIACRGLAGPGQPITSTQPQPQGQPSIDNATPTEPASP